MGARVVIAAGEPYLRLLIWHSIADLEDEGVGIIVTEDGPRALDAVAREAPAVLLLDAAMPGMSGFQVCAHLRADPALCQPHIILLIDRGQISDHRRGIDAGADRCLTRPFNPEDLLDAVRACLP